MSAAVEFDPVPALDAVDVLHKYDGVTALDHVSLSVAEGEFLTILGPSGSGKTTLLRIVGGFETPTAAERLSIAGIDVRGLPANHREVATVFQHYALFPHMTVGQNVEYGLKVRGIMPAGRRNQAEEALRLVRLSDKYGRKIHQLSGGERQRVAFARALVTQPRILLLDEPMGALDEKLRSEMQVEVRALQRQLKATFIQVTHSQEEALTMSDRIAVMNHGRIEQLGTPAEIFDRPATRFVAAFMGMTNLIDGNIGAIQGNTVRLDVAGQSVLGAWSGQTRPEIGQAAFAAIHPQRIAVNPLDLGPNRFAGQAQSAAYRGAHTDLAVQTALGPLTASVPASIGTTAVTVGWQPDACAIGPLSTS
jgi:putative spermidine/putrescine transport system ATP-binding protein/spermidine/putrescine transport system ATP-binding protein